MKKTIWLILVLFLVTPTLQAQETQPTLTAQDLYDWSHTLYFPQQVDFTLLAKRRESEISSLSLTLDYDGIDPITLDVDTIILTSTPGGSLYSYTWRIPSDTLPPLFTSIRYRWDITTTEGQQVSASADLVFEDTRVKWVQSNDLESRVDIYHAQNQLEPADIRSGIRAAYDLLFAEQISKPTYKLLIYPENVRVGCDKNDDGDPILLVPGEDELEAIPCDLEAVNRLFTQGDFIVFDQSSEANIEQNLIELIVEAYYEQIWGTADVPDWFLRGLQRFYDPRPDIEALGIAQQQTRSDNLLTLEELATEPNEDDLRTIWDAQSIGLVLYIADTIGVDALLEFANSITEADSFADAYENALGHEFDTLLLSWQDWLFLTSTEEDYEFQPYLPDTPTPTVTPTATNTPTVTFTPSNTPDITNTPRPTFTRRAPTPTITPLPAQSFSVQPTDIPPSPVPLEPELAFVADDDLVTRVAMGGAFIGLLFIVLLFVLRRR